MSRFSLPLGMGLAMSPEQKVATKSELDGWSDSFPNLGIILGIILVIILIRKR